MLQILSDDHISILLSQELGSCEVFTDGLEELCHSNVIFVKVLCDSNIVFGLLQEFCHRNIVACEELGHTDVILDLVEELGNRTVKKLVHISIICRSQILQDVLHVAFAIESV